MTYFMAEAGGKAAFALAWKYRKTAIENLDSVFPGKHAENVRTARAMFVNMARNGAEWIKLYSMPPEAINTMVTEMEGREHLDAVLAEGNGALALGYHFGNWELVATFLRQQGYEGAVVAKEIYFYKYDQLLTGLRERFGLSTIYRDESPRKMLRVLKDGKVLGVVPDQDVEKVEGVFVDFFGKPAYTPVAPVKLASAARTRILPTVMIRKPDNTHKLVIAEPIGPGPRERLSGDDIRKYTRDWNIILEGHVTRHPEQWVWLHRRWKTREQDRVKEGAR